VFYLLRDVFFGKENGWLIMWIVLVVVGVFSTFGPSPGSVEGLVHTTIPAGVQMLGLIEVLIQSLLLSISLFYWVRTRFATPLDPCDLGLFEERYFFPGKKRGSRCELVPARPFITNNKS